MILYHGSQEIIKEPDLFLGRKNVDFGQGFYLTDLEAQAVPHNMNYDIVIGNIANDEVIVAVDTCIAALNKGRATKNTKLALLDELSFSTPNSQYAFKTIVSLDCLKFIKSEEL